jgi:uncharacterized membrane protein
LRHRAYCDRLAIGFATGESLMGRLEKLFDEKNVHVAFEISLVCKGAFALAETAAGIFAYFVSRQYLLDLVLAMTRMELSEDPRDLVANYLLHAAQNLSVSSQYFTALYLLSHGIIKLWLIIGLWRRKQGYYPVAIVVFGLFIVYQVYRYSFTHSLTLLFITALDAIVIGLTWLEYRHLRHSAFRSRK